MDDKQTTRLRELAPRDELELLIREATASVEADLALEDAGWIIFWRFPPIIPMPFF